MSLITQRIIRSKVIAGVKFADAVLTDVRNGQAELVRANATDFQIGVFASDGTIGDLSQISSLTLRIRESQTEGATILAEKTVAAAAFDETVTANTWLDGTKQHAVFSFSNAEMNLDPVDSQKRYWLVLYAITDSGSELTLSAGWITFYEDNNAAADPPPENLGVAITLEEADARYAQLSELGDSAFLDVGTTAGTVAAGNDARFTDAREWTAETVSQAEAEAGTATTRRAWTAQRVFQAIASWVSGNSTSDGYSNPTKLLKTDAGGTLTVEQLVLGESDSGDTPPAVRFKDPNSEFESAVSLESTLTGNRVLDLPDATGTIAITSDLNGYIKTNGLLTTGAMLSINADPTKFNVAAGSAYIRGELVTWTAKTAVTVTNLASANLTHVFIDDQGDVYQQTTSPLPDQRRDRQYLGQLGHASRTSIASVANNPDVASDPNQKQADWLRCIGIYSCEGNMPSANGANLSINVSEGELFGEGIGWATDTDNPNELEFAELIAPTVRMRTQTGLGSSSTSVDVNNYDVAGTITAVPSNKWQNMRIYRLTTNNIVVQYGQTTYNTQSAAIAGVQSETFVKLENVKTIGALIGILTVKQGATALNDANQAAFWFPTSIGQAVAIPPLNLGAEIHAATEKTTPVDADEIPLADSAASFGLKKLTWVNLKATAKTYFDSFYSTIIAADKISRTDQILEVQRSIISDRQSSLPSRLRLLGLGDSFGVMTELVNSLSGKYHYIGRGLAALEKTYAGGAAALIDYTLWPASMHTLPSGGSITFGVSAFGTLNYPIFSDNLKVFYIAENGAGTFKIQCEYNLSGVWVDTSAGTINADNSSTPVGTVVSTSVTSASGLVKMRVVGLSGTVKIVGGEIALQTTNAAYPHVDFYDLSEGGTLISQQLNASSAVVTPILTAIAPDLVTWCADDGAAEITTNLPTLISQVNTRAASTPDWTIISTHPTGTGSQTTQQASMEAARAVAESNGYAFVDMFNYFGGNTTEMIAKGFLNVDNYHLSAAGLAVRGAEISRITGVANSFPRGFDAYLPEQVKGVSSFSEAVGAIWRIWSDTKTDRILDLSPIGGAGFDSVRLTAYKNDDANFPSGAVLNVASAPAIAVKSNGQTIIHKGTDFARATRVPTARLEIAGTSSETQFKVDSAAGLTEPLADLRVNGSQKFKVAPDGTATAAGKDLIGEQDTWLNASRLWSVKNALSFSGSGTGSYGDSNIQGWVNLGSGTADGGYRKVLIQRGINSAPNIVGGGVLFAKPIGVSFNYIGAINSASDTGRIRFIVGANNSAPAASGADAIAARGFGIELRRNGSNTEWRVFAHNGTTYTASSWATLLTSSLLTTAPSTIAAYSDGTGNITGFFGSGGAKATTTITTTGGPTATGVAADTYIAFEAINGTSPGGSIDTQLYDCQLYTPNA